MPHIGETCLHYELLEFLGQGSMGQVFKAKDTRLDRTVALKFLLNPDTVDASLKARFIQEAKTVARLDHTHIGPLYAIEESPDHLFFSMAYYQGKSLSARLREGLELQHALSIFKDLLIGFQYAHEQGVIHRDIKAKNIFITQAGSVKILDFGLARLPNSHLTHIGQMMGTPDYISPEQIKGEAVDARSDLWSLGVLLFQMLTGELPFEGRFPQIIASILKDDPRPLSQWLDQPALQTIIERCLSKDKRERFESCDALLAAIDAFESSENLTTSQPIDAPLKPNLIQLRNHTSPRQRREVSLIGRDQECEDLVALVSDNDTYLVNLTGVGGVGKTTLARAVMNDNRLESLFPDGYFFVSLDSINAPSQIPHAIAQAAHLQIVGQDPWESLHYLLTDKRVLLVLDNLEHLIDACAADLDALFLACPQVRVLATSRVVLNLEVEVIYDLKGLSVPQTADANLLNYGSTSLFISKAQRLKRSFDPKNHQQDIIAICQTLEGWPLGIELAVAWIRQLSPSEIAQKLTESLEFLSTRVRHQASRHQSARAAFEYSWQLLSVQAREALTKLAVFKGGFTTKAAFEVTGTTLETLALLVDASFLTITDAGRYNRHPLIDQFSKEIFEQYPAKQTTMAKFVEFFQEKTEEATDQLSSEQRTIAIQFFEHELENLQEVLAYYLKQDKTELGLQFTSFLNSFWEQGSYLDIAYKWNKAFLNKASSDKQARAACLLALGRLEFELGNFDKALVNLNQALGIAKAIDHKLLQVSIHDYLGGLYHMRCNFKAAYLEFAKGIHLAKSLNLYYEAFVIRGNLAELYMLQGDYQRAERTMNSLLSAARENNILDKVARCKTGLAYIAMHMKEFTRAETLFEESLELAKSVLSQRAEIITLTYYAEYHIIRRNYSKASLALEQAFRYYMNIQSKRRLATVMSFRALLEVMRQNTDTARDRLQTCLQLCNAIGQLWELIETINHTALFMVQQHNFRAAIHLMAATTRFRQVHEYIQFPFEASLTHNALTEVKSRIPSSVFKGTWDEGQQLSLEQAVELALSVLKS